jgi:deoxyribodipyrimidine photo-lyase
MAQFDYDDEVVTRLQRRCRTLSKGSEKLGKCVVYVMSRDQRVNNNAALVLAQDDALRRRLPFAVVFCLHSPKGYRTRVQYQFMLDGLMQVEETLAQKNIPFILLIGSPLDTLSAAIQHLKPAAVYFDYSPLRGSKKLKRHITKTAGDKTAIYEVDAHNVVPAWILSQKQEFAAHTLRRKMHAIVTDYLELPGSLRPHPYSWPGPVQTLSSLDSNIQQLFAAIMQPDRLQILPPSGEHAAQAQLQLFIKNKLETYGHQRNNPCIDAQSELSPYIHFGQISVQQIIYEVSQVLHDQMGPELHIIRESTMPNDERYQGDMLSYSAAAFVEELLVRRELAENYCEYNPSYDCLDGAPDWGKQTLIDHQSDPREFLYTKQELEEACTHDMAWNAAQQQLVTSGKMHGYMRMYWAKKVLEWSSSPEQAVRILVDLNDRYSIDGGDPNGYAGILWSVAGLHDRPWFERSIYGKIRYMNYQGLARKFDIETYIKKWIDA